MCAGVNLDIQHQLDADLKALVEGAAAKHASAGEISQQIGDLYASYMDEALLNKKGVEPVRPLLASVDAINDRPALNGVLVSFNGKTRVDDPFPVSVDIDPNNPTRYIPNIWQGGLSLGDRGYYVNTDPESVELRNKFVAHAARAARPRRLRRFAAAGRTTACPGNQAGRGAAAAGGRTQRREDEQHHAAR